MKKLLTLIIGIILGFTLLGCGVSYEEPLGVIAPNGAPALAQMFMQENEHYDVSVVNGADPLSAAFASGSHDFIYAPTNLGALMYNTNIDYKFIAAITFGNYYLVSMEENFTLESLEGEEIVVFGQNSTSDIILQYILDENEINATYRYVNSVSDANTELIIDNDIIILSAEPLLSVLKTMVSGLNTIDLQAEYQEITGESSYPQAGVFAKADLDSRYVDDFLEELEDSIDQVNSDLDAAVAKALELEYSFTESVLTTAIPNSNIDFKTASEVRNDLETYFNIILEMNGALIGGELPDDDFYF